MAASIEQKVDYLLKKIGYTASKTGIAEDSSLTGTKKAPFAEALPSPLVVPIASVYGQSEQIPATPPGATGGVVRVYGTATAFQMTEDNTVSGQRSWLARAVQGDNTSAMVGDWIDTQFGSDYIINVYAGDPNSGGTKLSAAGSGSNDTWFFDYSSGVLNFNGDAAPTAVTGGADVYLVGYRYTGTKGLNGTAGSFSSITASAYYLQDGSNTEQLALSVSGTDVTLNGIDAIDETTKATFESALSIAPNEFNDIVVSGLSTFNGTVDLNADIVGNGNISYTGVGSITAGVATITKATLGTGSTITGIGHIETLRVRNGAEFSGVTTFKGNVSFEGSSITGTIEQAERAFRLDAQETAGNTDITFAMPLVQTPGIDTSFLTTREFTYNPNSGIVTAPSLELSEHLSVAGVATIGTLKVNNPLENVVITNATITGDASVGGALTVTGVIDANGGVEGNLEGSADKVDVTDVSTTNTDFTLTMTDGANTVDGRAVGMDSDLTYNPSTNTLNVGILKATGEVEGGSLDINGNGDISGNLDVGGDLTVAGTLTYEDVTDIDAVGLITARSGIHVVGGGVSVASGIVTSNDGFDGNLTGNVTGNADSADQVKTIRTNTSAIHYLTFVDGDNSGSAANEDLNTSLLASFNPSDGSMVVNKVTATSNFFLGVDEVTSTATELNYLDGSTPGTATANNALVVDGNGDISGLGSVTAASFVGDGTYLTNLNAGIEGLDIAPRNVQVGGALTVTGATDLNAATTATDITASGTVDAAKFAVSGTDVLQTVNSQVALTGIATLDATTKATIEREIALAPNDFSSLNVTGVGTFGGQLNADGGLTVAAGTEATINGDLDVDGHTELDNLNVAGVATFSADVNTLAHLTANTFRATGVSTFVANANLEADLVGDGNSNISGINSVTASEFYGDGSNLTNINAAINGQDVSVRNAQVGGALTVTGATDLNDRLDVAGDADIAGAIKVAAASTFTLGVTFQDNIAVGGQAGAARLVVTGNSSLQDTQVGGALTVTGDIVANGDINGDSSTNITGINNITAGGSTQLGSLAVTGPSQLTGQVTGLNANFVGVVTVAGNIVANGDIVGDDATDISGIASVTAAEFYGNGAGLTNLNAGIAGLDIAPRHINSSGFGTFAQGLEVAAGGAAITGDSTITGALNVTGNATLGNDNTDTVTVNADVSSNLIPDGNGTRNLGDTSNRWNIFAADTNTTTLDVANNVTIGGNLSVGGTITSAELVELDIIAPVIELGLESVGDGTLQPPSTQTNYGSGVAMWYNRVGVSSDNAQAAAMFADLKPTGTYRIGFATDITVGDEDTLGAVNGWAEIEAKALWMNDCAGESVVINCTGTERFLNNITVDGGSF